MRNFPFSDYLQTVKDTKIIVEVLQVCQPLWIRICHRQITVTNSHNPLYLPLNFLHLLSTTRRICKVLQYHKISHHETDHWLSQWLLTHRALPTYYDSKHENFANSWIHKHFTQPHTPKEANNCSRQLKNFNLFSHIFFTKQN